LHFLLFIFNANNQNVEKFKTNNWSAKIITKKTTQKIEKRRATSERRDAEGSDGKLKKNLRWKDITTFYNNLKNLCKLQQLTKTATTTTTTKLNKTEAERKKEKKNVFIILLWLILVQHFFFFFFCFYLIQFQNSLNDCEKREPKVIDHCSWMM